MRRGAFVTAGATALFTLASLAYLWGRLPEGGATLWAVVKLAIVVVLVWASIGATMGFFIVMILRKNEGRG